MCNDGSPPRYTENCKKRVQNNAYDILLFVEVQKRMYHIFVNT